MKGQKALTLLLSSVILLGNLQSVCAETIVDNTFAKNGVRIIEEKQSKDEKQNNENKEELTFYKDTDKVSLQSSNNLENKPLVEDEEKQSNDEPLEISDEVERTAQSRSGDFIYDSLGTTIIAYTGPRNQDIVIPNFVKHIGPGALAGTPSLGKIHGRLDMSQATNLLTIGQGAFANNEFTGDLVINAPNLKSIDAYAFFGNNFTNVDLSRTGVETITKYSFAHAASDNSGSLILPSSLKVVEDSAFSGTAIKGQMTVRSGIKTETISFDRDKESEEYGFSRIEGLENSQLTQIENNAFSFNKLSNELKLPKTVEVIGKNAFAYNNLSGAFEIDGGNLRIIDDGAFLHAYSNGTNVVIKNIAAMEILGTQAFNGNVFSGNVELSNIKGLRSIGDQAFFSSKRGEQEVHFNGTLTLKDMPDLETIGKKSFSYESVLDPTKPRNLNEVRNYNQNEGYKHGFKELIMENLPSLKVIDDNAFMDNNFTNSLDFSSFESLTQINRQAFSNAGLTGLLNFKGLSNLNIIGNSAFFNTGVSQIDFSNSGIKTIDKLAFSGVPINGDLSIENLSNLESIGLASFQRAGALENSGDIKINNNPRLTKIDTQAFNNYTGTGGVSISNNPSLKTIEDYAFAQDYNEEVDATNEISKGLRLGPDLIIKNNGLTQIKSYAFYNNTFKGVLNLTNNPLTDIGNAAFGLNGFSCIELPNSVQPIDGMDKNNSDAHAFLMNNQNYKGGKDSEGDYTSEYSNLPIYVENGKGISGLTSLQGEYLINFSGKCKAPVTVKVKVVDEDTNEPIEAPGASIKLVFSPEKTDTVWRYDKGAEGETGKTTWNFEDVNMVAKPYIMVAGIDSPDYDLSPLNEPVLVPEPHDGVSEVVIKLSKNAASLNVNFYIENTTDPVPGIKPNPLVFENKKKGQVFNLTKQKSLESALEVLKNNYGYEMVPNQQTSITLKKGHNVLNIYFRSTGKTINIVKRDEKDPSKLMACIKFAMYDKKKYDQAVTISDLKARQQALIEALIETQTTNEQGRLSFKNVTCDVKIVELGVDRTCKKCGKNGDGTCNYDNYIPNKKITEISIPEFPDGTDIDYSGSVVNIIVPHTGTMGILPFILPAFICLLISIRLSSKTRLKARKRR